MKEVYIDSICHCHTTNDGAMTVVQTDFFDGKCDAYIEGHVFVLEGREYIRPSDGKVFKGEMIAPFKDYSILAAAQAQYETMLAEASAAYQEGVNSV